MFCEKPQINEEMSSDSGSGSGGLNNTLSSTQEQDVEPSFENVPGQVENEEEDIDDSDEGSPPGNLADLGNLNVTISQSQSGHHRDFDDFNLKKKLASNIKDQFMTTGCPNIDNFLNGGIIRSGLTEIVGPSAVGKTQLALQLSITAQLPEELGGLGLGTGVIYINTEGAFPSPRLAQLCEHFKTKFGSNLPSNPMDNILIKNLFDSDAVLYCVQSELPLVVQSKKVGLIIVDSIAATFRSEFDNEIASRTQVLRLVVRGLHDLAFNNNLVLVCLNQVGASMSSNILEYKDFAPSLGLAWRNLVNNRIVLSRKPDGTRWADVPFSCYIPIRSMPFELQTEGVYSSHSGPYK